MAKITLKDLHPDVILFLLDCYGMKLEVLDGDPENLLVDAKTIRITKGKYRVDKKVLMNGLMYPENLEAIMKKTTLDTIRDLIAAPYKLELDKLKGELAECRAELQRTDEELRDYKHIVHNGPICSICGRNMKGE